MTGCSKGDYHFLTRPCTSQALYDIRDRTSSPKQGKPRLVARADALPLRRVGSMGCRCGERGARGGPLGALHVSHIHAMRWSGEVSGENVPTSMRGVIGGWEFSLTSRWLGPLWPWA